MAGDREGIQHGTRGRALVGALKKNVKGECNVKVMEVIVEEYLHEVEVG